MNVLIPCAETVTTHPDEWVELEMYAFEMCPLWRGCVFSSGVFWVPLCECICAQCIHYLENACCELEVQDSLYHKQSSSFRDAYISDKKCPEKGREGMVRKRATERGRGEKQTSSIRYPQTHCKYMESITVHVWMDPVGDMHAGLVWSLQFQ